jgi:hypothetical protein
MAIVLGVRAICWSLRAPRDTMSDMTWDSDESIRAMLDRAESTAKPDGSIDYSEDFCRIGPRTPVRKLGLNTFSQLAYLGHQFMHDKALDEPKPEPERFSGGYYVGAKERNERRLAFRFDNHSQIIWCGKWAMRAMKERLGLLEATRKKWR